MGLRVFGVGVCVLGLGVRILGGSAKGSPGKRARLHVGYIKDEGPGLKNPHLVGIEWERHTNYHGLPLTRNPEPGCSHLQGLGFRV